MTSAGGEVCVPASPPREPLALGWIAPLGIVALSIVNFVLRIATLGMYHFWGKTEVRRRIWHAARINGEPLEYTGTGRELMIGFLVVFAIVLVPTMLLSFAVVVAFGPLSMVTKAFQVLVYIPFLFLLGVGTHKAMRYRLSRTRWRGIALSQGGSSWRYGWTYFWTTLLVPVTMGWIVPWRAVTLQRLLSRDMRFGATPFTFTATSAPLYRRYAVLWLGAMALAVIVGLLSTSIIIQDLAAQRAAGAFRPQPRPEIVALVVLILIAAYVLYSIISAWYRASQINHFAANTHIDGATFRGTATAGSLMWLNVSNFLMVLLTLGLLAPVAQVRSARYLVDRLSIAGEIGSLAMGPDDEAAITRGEGLAQVFDFDAF